MRKKTMRLVAVVLAAALILSTFISILASHAHAEAPERDRYTLEIELSLDDQALLITQRLSYTNRTSETLDRVLFAVYANQFRRARTVMYEDASAMPYGYAPGGVEFTSVTVDGADAEWGMQSDELFLRVACALAPGETREFAFEYAVLLTENAGFLGVDATDWRLSGFYPLACVYQNGAWEGNRPVQHTRYALTLPADYEATITLPDEYVIAATGSEERVRNNDDTSTWRVYAEGIREFSMSIGRAWRVYSDTTDSGVEVRVFSNNRLGGPRALETTLQTIALYESWFGAFPVRELDIVESGYALHHLAFSGAVWLSPELFDFSNRAELAYQLRFSLAEQYFGLSVYADPLADAWMSTSICEYITYLALEETDGYDAFLRSLNGRVRDALQITVPGDLYITADGSIFSQAQFNTVVRDRGAAVMHETRVKMGRDAFLSSLARFYADSHSKDIVVETDLVKAMDAATGGSWESFFTDILFNIGDYADQLLDWYE